MSDLEGRLAAALKGVSERHLEDAPRRPGAVQRAVIQRARRRWGAFVVGVSAVAALVLAAVAVSIPELISERTEFPSGGAQGQLVPVTTTIEIGKNPVAIAADDRAVWVALGDGFVQRIVADDDVSTTSEVAQSLTDVAVGADQVWATGGMPPGPGLDDPGGQYGLYQIYPRGEFDLLVEHKHQSLAVTSESVWSIATEPNPEGSTLNRFSFDEGGGGQAAFSGMESTGRRPEGIVADGDSLWTVGRDGGSVIHQLDGVTGEVRREFIGSEFIDEGRELSGECNSCRPAASPIAVGDGSVVGVWEGSEKIALVDLSSGDFRLVDVAGELGETLAVTIFEGAAWVVIENDRVARIDLESGELIGEPIEVGPDPVDIAAGAGAVWTINRGDGTLTRIDLVQPDPAPVERATQDDEASPYEKPSPPSPSPTPSATPRPTATREPPPIGPSPSPGDPSDRSDVDSQMGELIDAVGAPCRNFDFQSMEEFEGNPYRPAFCNDGDKETILLFSFATEEERQAWVDGGRESEFTLSRPNSIVVGLTWEAHVVGGRLHDFSDFALEVAARLEGELIRTVDEAPSGKSSRDS